MARAPHRFVPVWGPADLDVDARLLGCCESALETVNGFTDEEPVEPVEEDKTLVYLGLAGVLLVVGGVLLNYIMKIGNS